MSLVSASSVLKQYDLWIDDVHFQQDVDEGEESRFDLKIKEDLWEDMGSPEFSTIKVEPGDTLNG
jgi:hypothetical protein